MDLAHQRLVGAEEQLLPGLAPRVERARHLGPAEGSVVEQSAVLAGEGNALGHALIDDIDAQLREPVHVRFARPVIAALDGVVEQAVDAVAVVLVVLGGVDTALRGDAVRPPRAVLDAETEDVVAELAERGRRRRPRQSGADADNGVLALVGRIDQLHLELVPVPLGGHRAGWNLRVERHARTWVMQAHTAIAMKLPAIRTATSLPATRSRGVQRAGSMPSDWKALDAPCQR